MIHEKSCGAVIFRREGKKILFLLIKYKYKSKEEYYYDLPRGHMEKGEDEKGTALREVREETGLADIILLEGFKEKFNIFFRRGAEFINKQVIMFLAETKSKEVKLSFEHYGYEWLPYEAAIKQIMFKNTKEILEKADKFLKNLKEKQNTLI